MQEDKTSIPQLLELITGKEQLEIFISPGTATSDQIAEFLAELSVLYRMIGGSGISYTPGEIRVLSNAYFDEW